MKKITVKELVEFKRKSSERTKKSFAFKLKNREVKNKIESEEENGGGDYWITSTSCIYNVFKQNNDNFYDSKIDELHSKYENSEDKRTQSMYKRNIDILTGFKDFDFNEIKPSTDLKFEKIPKSYKILTIKKFPLYLNPSILFSYIEDDKKLLGALWLIPQLNGFKKSELGMFCEILYRFLIKNYSNNYQISEDFCIAVDTYNGQKVSYTELVKGYIPFLIDQTLDEIKEL